MFLDADTEYLRAVEKLGEQYGFVIPPETAGIDYSMYTTTTQVIDAGYWTSQLGFCESEVGLRDYHKPEVESFHREDYSDFDDDDIRDEHWSIKPKYHVKHEAFRITHEGDCSLIGHLAEDNSHKGRNYLEALNNPYEDDSIEAKRYDSLFGLSVGNN